MKKYTILFSMLIAVSVIVNGQKGKVELKNELDTVSYSMGIAIGNSMKMAGFTQFNDKLFYQALTEVLNSKETIIKPEATNNIIQSYMMKLHTQLASKNLAIGRKYLEENKTKEGVVVLPSGLQYKVIKQGEGISPTVDDKVTCHYHGTLIDGKVFDSSVQRGKPAQFAVNGVIAGWTEALQLMKTGAKWILYVPSELAYGEQNVPGIEPNSVLIFEVELISVEKQTEQNKQ
jgi:FKBP-type peptidyl-prolyl cis-trans isomerase FklB